MSSERDNRMRWRHRPGHYEAWFATLTHRASRTGFWIRYTLRAPVRGLGEPYAQLWFARFSADRPEENFGVHRRYPPPSSTLRPLAIGIGDGELRHDRMRGSLAGRGHRVRWDLTWTPAARTYRHLPELAYHPLAPVATRVVSPSLSVPFSGVIEVDGRAYDLDGDRGCQSHLWGRKHAYQWAWAHCDTFDGGERAVLEALSVRLKHGAVVSPLVHFARVEVDGEPIDLRGGFPLLRGSYRTGRYFLHATDLGTEVEAELSCRPEDMIFAEYLDPDGDAAFCHNSCSSDLRLTVRRRTLLSLSRYRVVANLAARGTAHWEWGARAGDALRVERRHVLLTDEDR